MSRRAVLVLAFGLILIGVFSAAAVHAQEGPPPWPQALWGKVEVNGQPAPVGAKIEARGDNVLVGTPDNPITVTVAGQYGEGLKLTIQGQLQDGQPIEFYVDGVKAQAKNLSKGQTTWQDSLPYAAGFTSNVDLRVVTAATPEPTQDLGIQPPETQPTTQPTSTATPQPAVSTGTATATALARTATATAPAASVTVPPAQTGHPATATSLPGAVVSQPTGAATAAPPDATPVPPTETAQATLAPADTATPAIEPTRVEPTATIAKVAAVPNATVKPILDEAKPPEAVQSTSSEISGSSGRNIALWAGLGLVLVAVALGVLVKMRGLPR